MQRYHRENYFESCILCKKPFNDSEKLQKHLVIDHGPSDKFLLKESAFEENVVHYRLTFDQNERNFNNGQNKILDEIKNTIRFEAGRKTVIKVNLIYICQMAVQDLANERVQTALIPFRSTAFITNGLRSSNLSIKIKKSFRQQENFFEEFCDSGSNWTFDRAVAFDIEIGTIKPIVMGAPRKLLNQEKLKHKKFLYDPENQDEKCFLRCVYYLIETKKTFDDWKRP